VLDKEKKLKKGQKTAAVAIWLEGALVIAKTVIGLLSGSIVLISDAIHSASDVLSIITAWLTLKIARKKADERFSYGYYKAENLGSFIISLFILYASWKMFSQGYLRLFSFSQIKIPLLALAISLLDALILFFFGRYEIKIGKQVNAQSLIAMGEENKTHIFSSTAVFLGIVAAYYQIPYIEGIITTGISFLILKIGLATAKNSAFALMDVSPSEEIKQKAVIAIESVSEVEEFFDLRLRKSGPFYFGEVKVGIRKFVDVKKAHEISHKVEEGIKKKVPQVESFMVHLEPFKSDWRHLVIPITSNNGLDSKIDDKFARAPYFLFVNLKKKKVKGFYILKNPYTKKKVKTGLAVAKLISRQKSDTLIIRQIGEIAFYALKENLFDIYQTENKTVKTAIKSFSEDRFTQLRKATKSV